jgi:hypothetical protein
MNDDRIDFSALDPSRDAGRWEALADAVAGRALRERRRSKTVAGQLAAWWRPALAAAAVIAAAVGISSAALGPPREGGPGSTRDSDAAFVAWALGGPTGSVWDELERAGGCDGDR